MHSPPFPLATLRGGCRRKEKEQQQEEAREQQWEDIYGFFFNLDLDSPCFGGEGVKEEHLKACARHRGIYIDFP